MITQVDSETNASAATHPSAYFKRWLMHTLLALFAALLAMPALAEQKEEFGDYEVHYNVINSTFLTPEIAKQYDIVRSNAMGLVNISVLKKEPGAMPKAVNAQVEGEVTNVVEQQNRLAFHRVSEGQAIYYLASFQFTENDPLTFTVRLLIDPNKPPVALRFSQTLFHDK